MNIKSMPRIAILATVLVVCLMFPSRAAERVTLTGWISCTTCLLPDACKARTRLSCVQWWVRQGASYVLVVGDKHYVLSGFERELAKAAAENSVTVTGDLVDNHLTVVSVESPSKHEK